MNTLKGYSDGPEGQVHWRMAAAQSGNMKPDLYCFSPAPFSSLAYTTIMPYLADDRRVIAPDYPGQGSSEGGSATPSISQYAETMIAVIKGQSGAEPVTLTGFHSGCLVAVEVALIAPEMVSQIVLVDVPAFDPETRAKYLPAVGAPFEMSSEIESLSKSWDMAVTKRLETQPLERSFAMFADSASNGPRINATFHAAFTYDVEGRFGALETPTGIIATKSGLLEPTRHAAQLISQSAFKERLDITSSVLDQNASETASEILAFLG